ncbi:MAG TPA: cation diffusion facilitator family transporter [Candidatus Binatia bacterium]|jgi:cobalt-zinc-cadmium efflux system protein
MATGGTGGHAAHGGQVASVEICSDCEIHSPRDSQQRRRSASRLSFALVLAAVYMVAEAVGGWVTNSLSLLADSGHMLSDVAALGISLAAMRAATLAPTSSRTYGYHRAEALAALLNAVALDVVAVIICWEAFRRLSSPPEVTAGIALLIATGGLVINLAGLAVLHGDHDHGLVVRSAWLHLIGDALGSVGAMTSAALISLYGWRWADPLASLLIALLIVRSATTLLLETLGVLMEAAPHHIDVDSLRRQLEGIGGVTGVHDLHVWTITSGMDALSGHVVVAAHARGRDVLAGARVMLHERFGIDHVTLQLEDELSGDDPVG